MGRTLTRTRRNWDRFAAIDPMTAILLRDERAPAWEVEAFFQSGVDYCRMVMADILGAHGLPHARTRALDFGCGMGRLTNALAGHFDAAVGVDISRTMLDLAEKHRRRPNVTFVHNVTDDLPALEEGSFDLVLSVIVLQHIPVDAIRRYIGEFIRVVRPGGAVLFQLPVRTLIVDRGRVWAALNECRRILYRPRRILELPRRLPRVLGIEPMMEMHGIPRDEVTALVASRGARVVDAIEDQSTGGVVPSFLYLVTKP